MDIASLVSDWGLLLTGISNAAVNILRVGMKQPFSWTSIIPLWCRCCPW